MMSPSFFMQFGAVLPFFCRFPQDYTTGLASRQRHFSPIGMAGHESKLTFYARKAEVATAVGRINRHFANTGKNLLFMAPGRVGTSSPELGVPTRFADISCFAEICEVSDSRTGFMPELSYGSHMFQDMVEAEMTYSAIWNDGRTLRYTPNLLEDETDIFADICPDLAELKGMITVREPRNLHFWLDSVKNWALCGVSNS